MPKEQIAMRLISIEAEVDLCRLMDGELRESDWEKFAAACAVLQDLDIRIEDNPMLSVADMCAQCQNIDNLGLVVIDYLQLIQSADKVSTARQNRYETVSDIFRAIKIMARLLDVPVLCLSQLNRASEKREDKRPVLSDLRESGTLEDDSDVVMFLYRDDLYYSDSEKTNIAECIVAKNRHGETGCFELRWILESGILGEIG